MAVTDKRMKLELVGHTSLALLCLLGVCLYTFTYNLLYYGGKTHAVAVLEMWMLFSQLYVACVCGGIQLVAAAFLGQGDCGVPRVGDVQSAAFLGIALAVTCIGTACVGGGVECAVYFPAAISGPLASAGAIAWSVGLVMFNFLLLFLMDDQNDCAGRGWPSQRRWAARTASAWAVAPPWWPPRAWPAPC